jgi:two-component system, repressor protein LuxO
MMKSSNLKVLVADNQPSVLRLYTKTLGELGHGVDTAGDLRSVQSHLDAEPYQILIIDLGLVGEDMEETLRLFKATHPEMKIIAVCDRSSISGAVTAIKAGCEEYFAKPISMLTLENALIKFSKADNVLSIKERKPKASLKHQGAISFIGDSLPMQSVQKTVGSFARSTAPVLITGESGTGKEVCAAELHYLSERKDRPFIAINCAALPSDLMESELFGHVKGAFTGAATERAGAAFSAHGGTLFLDEIGEMDIRLQAKLLRFLQTGEIKRVGSDKTQTVDVRVICATNRDLPLEIQRGNFREDLFYRLNVLSIEMPPLRRRGNDVVVLAQHFYDHFVEIEGSAGGGLTASAVMALVEYDWPGNVRELQNVIRRAVVVSGGGALDAYDLMGFKATSSNIHPFETPSTTPAAEETPSTTSMIDILRPFVDIEREIVERVIQLKGGSLPQAAVALELSPSTLYRKREAWGANGVAV